MHESSQGEMYLEPILECDEEVVDPLGEVLAIPAPNVNLNVCKSHC